MSRKTRQEKIIADLRRKLQATKETKWEVGSVKLETEVRNEKAETKTSHLPPQNPVSPVPLHTSQSTSYIKKDLTKTLILTILAISLELVLYFLFRVGRF